MSQAHRQSRGLHPIREASKRWRAEIRRAHTGPDAPVRGRLQSCAAGVPTCVLAGALSPVCAAIPPAKAGGRPVRGCFDRSAGGPVSSNRDTASLGLGVPYAIIRPTLVFGVGDLLLNNMAWALRRFAVFPVYGSGDYPVQPIYVEDLAAQAVEAGSLSENSVADAAGPDTFSFEALLRLLASTMGVRKWFLHTPPRVGLALTGLVGLLMRDMALTRDEVVGLMDGLLTSGEPPTGTTRLTDWLAENGDGLGAGPRNTVGECLGV